MKAKNLEVGLKVQVKDNTDSFYEHSYGKVGTIVELDQDDNYDVRVEFEDGSGSEWGNHKDIRKYVFPFKVGDTVKVLEDGAGFYRESYGKVGTVVQTDEDSSLDIKIAFDGDDADWGNHSGVEFYVKPEPVEPSEPEPELKVGAIVQVRKANRDGLVGFSHRHNNLVGVVSELDCTDNDLNVRVDWLRKQGGLGWGNTDELVVLKEVDSNTPKGTRVIGIQDGKGCLGGHYNFKDCVGTVEDTLQDNNLVGIRWDSLDDAHKYYHGLDVSMVRVLGE